MTKNLMEKTHRIKAMMVLVAMMIIQTYVRMDDWRSYRDQKVDELWRLVLSYSTRIGIERLKPDIRIFKTSNLREARIFQMHCHSNSLTALNKYIICLKMYQHLKPY